jgi:hypothetical protein
LTPLIIIDLAIGPLSRYRIAPSGIERSQGQDDDAAIFGPTDGTIRSGELH